MTTVSPKGYMRVVSIDPGYDRCGVAVLEKKLGEKEKLIYSSCLETSSKSKFTERLFQIISGIEKVIDEYNPNFFVVEKVFFSTNKKTALYISEVRGAMLYLAKKRSLLLKEMHPNEIKTAVTGDGKSTKEQMIKMVQLITGFRDKVKDDQYDAIAVGLAFMAVYREGVTELD